jgi:hypothetical protein
MQSKSFLIAVAAFALTATSVHAHVGQDLLKEAGLNEKQIEAFAEARELKKSGKITKARDVLVEAGVTEDTLKAIFRARKLAEPDRTNGHGKHQFRPNFINELSEEQREAIKVARQANDKESVKAIFKEAGIDFKRRHREE